MTNMLRVVVAVLLAIGGAGARAQQEPSLPDYPLQFAAFAAQFQRDGTFSLQGAGWPPFKGTWKAANGEVEILTPGAPAGCDKAGRYRVRDARRANDDRTSSRTIAARAG